MAEMEKNWFDLADVRKRFLAKAVWVPLHASEEINEGEYGYVGWRDEFFGLSSVAVPLSKRVEGLKLGWSELNNSQGVWATEKLYKPAEIFQSTRVTIWASHSLWRRISKRAMCLSGI
ncbi:hypothetical protein ACQZ6S_14015 [Agrobacterium tumefaciens]